MTNLLPLVCIVIAYFLGNISPAILIGRVMGVDIRSKGSGNAGTTNVLRVLGKKAALATLAIDIAKGVAAVLLGRYIGGQDLAMVCGLAAFIGHIWPIVFRFKGGKGIATTFGVVVTVEPLLGLIAAGIAIFFIAVSRRVSLGSIVGALLVPFIAYRFDPDYLPWTVAMAIIILIKHRTNIKRLLKGEEPKLSFKKKEENQLNKKIAVIGAGSWGTALAVSLSAKGHTVNLWEINEEHLQNLNKDRENKRFLPEVRFPEKLQVAFSREEAIKDADIVLFSVPAQHFRSAFEGALPLLKPEMVIVNVAKGIEQKSLKRLSEIAFGLLPEAKYVVLSGPSHAEEVGKALPTTVVSASKDPTLAEYIQDVFMTENFRVYTNTDVIGVELGGALKNIIALGAGISDGMGYGDNAKAAMMTRGITEMARLGVALGAELSTFSGLAGIGDLIVTCTSMHSRNRRCGIMIGEGLKPSEATKAVGMVVEGMFTTEAAYQLAKTVNVEMPITEQIYRVINEEIDAREAVKNLMTRQKKHEMEDVLVLKR